MRCMIILAYSKPHEMSTKKLQNVDVNASFEYIKKLGEGGYGEVWKVRDRQTGEILALKLLFKNKMSAQTIADTIQEVEILTRISSTKVGCNRNIVCYRDIFNCGDRLCIAMEFVEGREVIELLAELADADMGLPPSQLHSFMKQSLEALALIHAHGVAHRDIKEENMIIKNDHTVVLVDFGFACYFDENKRYKEPYQCTGARGTRSQIAPEVSNKSIVNHKAWWPKADVWSLGITFTELALGTQFEESWGESIANGYATRVPILEGGDPTLAAIINDMVNPNPGDRPTAKKLLARINAYTPRHERA